MDFQKLLLDVGRALCKDEVKALAFLCADLLNRNLASVETAGDLFSRLADQDRLSAERPHLLTELLLIIQRPSLIRELRLTDQASATTNLISSYSPKSKDIQFTIIKDDAKQQIFTFALHTVETYLNQSHAVRTLLYNLSEEITKEDLKDMKFLLNRKLPRRKLEENVTTLEVFLEMEHMDLISNTHLNLLETIFEKVCPMLKEKIRKFQEQQVLHTSPIAQETYRPRSMTYPPEPTQDPQSLDPERSASCGMPEFQPLAESAMNYSNTSVDFPDVSHGEDHTLSHGLSQLSTETSRPASLTVRSDALVVSQENETSSERQTSRTTNTNTEVLGTYPMTAAKRGICLIINNYDFSESKTNLLKREGTMVDEQCLQQVFNWLGFEVQIQRDCESAKVLSVMKELGNSNHSQMDCLVCCILSHGKEGSVYGVDGCTVLLKSLMELVNGGKCPSLVGKPKLFFIQACQGNSDQKPVYIEADSVVCSDAIEARESIPRDADFLLAMATVPSFVSYRDKKKGTWFIQSLCKNLVQMVPSGFDLVSILTKVNADVSLMTDTCGVKKQMPQPSFSLRKKVVFPIPEASPPCLSQ